MNLQFNFDKKCGKIKPMHAVGQPPFCLDLNKIYSGMLHYLKEANIPYSRMHDVGGPFGQNLFVDIPNIFRNFDADENDPESYDFIFTDALFEELKKVEGEIERLVKKLSNAEFVGKAPEKVVAGERAKLEKYESQKAGILDAINAL